MEDPSRRRMILEKMERNLVIALNADLTNVKISRAVEKVREAKLSFLKGQREIAQYHDTTNVKLSKNIEQHLMNIESNIMLWRSLSENDIIAKAYNIRRIPGTVYLIPCQPHLITKDCIISAR